MRVREKRLNSSPLLFSFLKHTTVMPMPDEDPSVFPLSPFLLLTLSYQYSLPSSSLVSFSSIVVGEGTRTGSQVSGRTEYLGPSANGTEQRVRGRKPLQ